MPTFKLNSKLRKEILQRRQYSISIDNRLTKEAVLIDIPNNTYDNYFDAYRASTSDNVSTRKLSSLREKLNYEAKRKYAKMLDTQSVDNILEKTSQPKNNSEYDLIWKQANLARKIKPNSNNMVSNHSLKINENKSSSSLKRPNIALRRMKEQKTNSNTDNINNNNSNNNNNNNNNNNSIFANNSINVNDKNLASSSNSYNSIKNSTKISDTKYTDHNMNDNILNSKNSINNNAVPYSYSSSSSMNNHKDHYTTLNSRKNESQYLSLNPNINKLSSSNIQRYNSTSNDNNEYSSTNGLNDEIQKREDKDKDIKKDMNSSSNDQNKYSSSEIYKFIKPYITQRVKNRHITKEQYKKLTKDTTYYVLKRLGDSYKGEHKLNYDELKEDFLVDHSFSNKIIINFINYNIIKFREINKNQKASSSNNKTDHPKPI